MQIPPIICVYFTIVPFYTNFDVGLNKISSAFVFVKLNCIMIIHPVQTDSITLYEFLKSSA